MTIENCVVDDCQKRLLIRAMDDLIAAYDEYLKLLAESEASMLALAYSHGWRCPEEKVKRGEELRARIEELKQLHVNSKSTTE